MRIAYVDTSAALKLIVNEPERHALQNYLDDNELVLVSSWLLYTEMLCAVGRRSDTATAEVARQALDLIEFVDVTRHDFITASRLTPLRSADAVHLAVALRLQASEIVTYDAELIAASPHYGVLAVSPR